jgi:hypothetical protein
MWAMNGSPPRHAALPLVCQRARDTLAAGAPSLGRQKALTSMTRASTDLNWRGSFLFAGFGTDVAMSPMPVA